MRRRGREGEARENKHIKGGQPPKGRNKRSEEDLYEMVSTEDTPLLLILDCVQDPHNLGAILRTADGAGVMAVVAPRDKSAGITETVRRISVGGAGNVPFL